MGKRETIFISKATPEDDDFVLWLAPRLEASGYKVFADILTIEAGDRWRKIVTQTLQEQSIKMLLCCRDSTLAKDGVQDEIGIAEDVAKEVRDPRLIVPLRIAEFKKIPGIGELQHVDFVGSWASGFRDLLDTLEKQCVPRCPEIVINPNWEGYKKRLAKNIEQSPEDLTTNLLRIAKIPETIRYYHPPGAVDHSLMQKCCNTCSFPAEVYQRGFFSFARPEEVGRDFSGVAKFVVHSEYNTLDLLEKGSESPFIKAREAENLVLSMFRKSWENFSRMKELYPYQFSNQLGFHVTKHQVPLGKRIFWGRQGQRRWSMLRNVAGGKVWQYGISATPHFWPFPHLKLKARVIFAERSGNEAGEIFDTEKQHRLRRTICKVWRNKAWHGRMMAFLELLSAGKPQINIPLSDSNFFTLDATPVSVTSPVTTYLPDTMSEEAEEQDGSTFGALDVEEDE